MNYCLLNYCRFIYLLFGVFSVGLNAQNYKLQVQEYGLEDGLSSYNILSVFQDSRGLVWIATDYGLNRYDGRSFKTYTKEENGLCSNLILFISEDEKGNLWLVCGGMGTRHCHVVFDPIKEKVYSLSEYTGQEVPFDESEALAFPRVNGSIMYVINSKGEGLNCTYYEHNGETFEQIFEHVVDTIGDMSRPETLYHMSCVHH